MDISHQFVSGKDTFFITLTKLNELKVWDIYKPEGSNLIAEIKQTLNSRSTCFAVFYDESAFLAAIGSENGTITIWDIPTCTEIAQYAHKASITAIAFENSFSILSTSEDLNLIKFNRTSKEQNSVKCKALIYQIFCLEDSIIAAGNEVQILDKNSLKPTKDYVGDAKAVKLLRVNPIDRKYFFAATSDRFINVYKVSSGKSTKKAKAKAKFQLRLEGNPLSLSVFQEGTTTKVAAVTDQGNCELWSLDLKNLKKVKEPIARQQTICFASPPSESTALRAAFFKSSNEITVAKGFSAQPTFQILALSKDSTIIVTDSKPSTKLSKKRKRNDVEVIAASDSKTNGVLKKNAKRVKLSPPPKPSSSPDPPASRPSAGTLETLVTQALTTQDETLFHEILRPKKGDVVALTVARLRIEDAESLLRIACEAFRKNFRRGPDLLPWIEELVSHHGLSVNPDILKMLTATVEERVKYLQPILKLQGKVNLLIQRKTMTNEVQATVVYTE